MTIGHEVAFDGDWTLDQAQRTVRATLGIAPEFDIHLFLPSGLRFSRDRAGRPNTVNQLLKDVANLRPRLYAVITRHIPDDILNTEVDRLCDARAPKQCLLCPALEATPSAYNQIAALLGFLHVGAGDRGTDLVKAAALVSDFAPLVCGLSRIVKREVITALTVATVCASYFWIVRRLLPTIAPPAALEYSLHCACWLVHLEITPGFEPTQDCARDGSTFSNYLRDTHQDELFVQYVPDSKDSVKLADLTKDADGARTDAITRVFDGAVSFKPIGAIAARRGARASILGEAGGAVVLCLGEDAGRPDRLRICDPAVGVQESVDADALAARLAGAAAGGADIREIIEVCVDVSGSMRSSLANCLVGPTGRKDPATGKATLAGTSRMDFLWQLMESLAHRLFGFHVPCLLGVLAFNETVVYRAPFSPLSTAFLGSLGELKPKGGTHLWDALARGLANLLEERGKGEYTGVSRLRILAFADGCDNGSTEVDKVALAARFISAKVIVDSVLLTTAGKPADLDLARLSHLTGGVSYQVAEGGVAHAVFENESFLVSSKRPEDATRPHPLPLSAADFEGASARFDEALGNAELLTATRQITRLHSPGFEVRRSRGTDREKRLLRELADAGRALARDAETIKLYVNGEKFDEWKLWIRGPRDTDYVGKWWYVSVLFAPEYPREPPLMRFVTIPYHMNVSEDGRICSAGLCQRYNPNVRIIDLIREVQGLLAVPDPVMSVSYAKTWDYFRDRAKYRRDAVESTDDAIPDIVQFLRRTEKKEEDLPDAPEARRGRCRSRSCSRPPSSGPVRGRSMCRETPIACECVDRLCLMLKVSDLCSLLFVDFPVAIRETGVLGPWATILPSRSRPVSETAGICCMPSDGSHVASVSSKLHFVRVWDFELRMNKG
jgi:ubiquitin-protein ligase